MQHKRNWVQTLCILYIIIWTIAPPLGIDMIYRLLALGCVGIWFIFASARRFYIQRIHIQVALFVMLVILVAIVEHGDFDGVLNQIALYILAVCFFMNTFYEDGRWEELRGIIPIVLILLAVFNHRTAEILAEDPSIARRLVRADASTFDYMRQGIGGYGLIYPQVCIFPAILMWTISSMKKNRLCFVVGIIWLITYYECVSSSGYSIAIYVTVLGAIMLFFYKGRKVKTAILISALIFIGAMALLLYNEGFRNALIEIFDGTEVVNKINDIVSTSETGQTEDSIYYRMEAYKYSIDVIMRYPVIGSLWNMNGGGHSAILDTIAKYGIFGGFVYCSMLFSVPNRYKKKYQNRKIWCISNAVIIAILYVAMLDSVPFNFMGLIMLLLPLLFEDIIKWESIYE